MDAGEFQEIELPQPLIALLNRCKTRCIAGCCGPEAFEDDREYVARWCRVQEPVDVELALGQVRQFLRDFDRPGPPVLIHRLNYASDRRGLVDFFRGFETALVAYIVA